MPQNNDKENLAIRSINFLIRSYQTMLSPFLGKNCKHYPSCSNYSQESFNKHGFIVGFILSLARLIRCNPWSLGGYDPVPDKPNFKDIQSFKLLGNYQTQLYKTEEQ